MNQQHALSHNKWIDLRTGIAILALAAVAGGPAEASGSGSCALGAHCSSQGCWTAGPGDPFAAGDTAFCIHNPESPPCYICIYTTVDPHDPDSNNWVCAQDPGPPDTYLCRECDTWGTPDCPNSSSP